MNRRIIDIRSERKLSLILDILSVSVMVLMLIIIEAFRLSGQNPLKYLLFLLPFTIMGIVIFNKVTGILLSYAYLSYTLYIYTLYNLDFLFSQINPLDILFSVIVLLVMLIYNRLITKLYKIQRNNSWILNEALRSGIISAIYMTQDYKIVSCTNNFYDTLGYNSEEKLKLNDIIHSKDLKKVKEAVEEIIRDKETINLEFRLLGKDGKIYWVNSTFKRITIKGSLNIFCYMKDATETKNKEYEVREKQRNYRKIVNNMSYGVAVVSKGKIIYANRKAVNLLGARNLKDVIDNDSINLILNSPKLKKRHRNFSYRYKITQLDNELLRVDNRGIEVEKISIGMKYNGNPSELFVLRDVTHRNKMFKKLKESEEKYRGLVEFMPDGLMLFEGKSLIFMNDKAKSIFGYSNRDSYIGKSIQDFLHPDYWDIQLERLKMVSEGYKNLPPVEYIGLKNNGDKVYIESLASSYSSEGRYFGITIFRDITKKREEELFKLKVQERERKMEEELKYERLKGEFFANLSHELRTPLNIIFNAIQIMDINYKSGKMIDESGNSIKYLLLMRKNANRLLRMVNNIIDTTKIDSGYYEFHNKKLEAVGYIENIVCLVAKYIRDKNLDIIFDTNIEEKYLTIDPECLGRIILNLIANSVKFTPEGGRIEVRFKDLKDKIIISVKDNGIGIPFCEQKNVFESFKQVNRSTTRLREGSGLGLFLVKSLIQMMGGKIELKSKVDKGSEFIIILPSVLNDAALCEVSATIDDLVEKINIEFSDII